MGLIWAMTNHVTLLAHPLAWSPPRGTFKHVGFGYAQLS